MFQDNYILVTGGAGFIGSNLIGKLLQNHKIVCIDNFNDYYNPEWKRQNIARFLDNDNFHLIELDILDYKSLQEVFAQYKIFKIIHLAARAGVRPSLKDPFLYQSVNLQGTLNLLELSKIHKVEQFIFASSSSVYGNQKKTPFDEDDRVDNPVSPYAASKKSAELWCSTYAHLYKIPITCLRFFTVYGPSGRPDMAPYLFTKAIVDGKAINKFGDGSTKRDYTFIDDIVEGILKSIENVFDFEIINLGNNKPVTLNKFIATLENIIGKKAKIVQKPIPAGDVLQTYANISKANRLLNWKPKTSLAEGLNKFVIWYKQNRI